MKNKVLSLKDTERRGIAFQSYYGQVYGYGYEDGWHNSRREEAKRLIPKMIELLREIGKTDSEISHKLSEDFLIVEEDIKEFL